MSQSNILNEVCKIIESIGETKCISILDIGCGAANYWKSVYLKFKIKKWTGVDIESEQNIFLENNFIEFLKQLKENQDACPVDFAFFEKTKIENFVSSTTEKYDLIVCFCILSLFTKEKARFLISDFDKILNYHGLIAFCIPNEDFDLKSQEDFDDITYDLSINKFKLNSNEFMDFIKQYAVLYHKKISTYHWAIICRK
jgi:SAM-dependent methyltransferase